MRGLDAWLERPFQDACDLADKLEAVEDEFLATDRFREEYAKWAEGDPTSTQEMFMATAIYENLLEQYADEMYPPEDYY